MEQPFDCIVVGGGIAGLSAAMILAQADARFLLVERGEFCGSKNVSGGVLWGTDLARLVPDYWKGGDGFERFVNHRRLTLMDESSAFTIDFKSADFDAPPYMGITVLRARFDEWFAARVQEAIDRSSNAAESLLATNILVDALLLDGDRVVGIRTGEEKFYAHCVIIAEGVNNLLTRQVGIEPAYVPADHVAVGVKEVISLDRKVLEDRFQLSGSSGITNEFVGSATSGVEGGGFLYTNRESLSVGLVLAMKDLREKGGKPYDLLDTFKAHPAVADMIRGGKVLEYSAHVVSTGDVDAVPARLFGPGVLVAGEAAHLLLNSGKAIQGMDYAMRSGMLAAGTVLAARESGDFGADSLSAYQQALKDSYLMKDMHGFNDAAGVFHSETMYRKVPAVLCDFGRSFFGIGNEPTPRAREMMMASIRKHASVWEFARLGLRAARAL